MTFPVPNLTPVTVIIESLLRIVDLGPQTWDEQACGLETETDYILYQFLSTG